MECSQFNCVLVMSGNHNMHALLDKHLGLAKGIRKNQRKQTVFLTYCQNALQIMVPLMCRALSQLCTVGPLKVIFLYMFVTILPTK